MFKPTVEAALEAASVLFNLPEYRVLATVRDEAGQPGGVRRDPGRRGGVPVVWGIHRPGASADPATDQRRPLRCIGHGVVDQEAMAMW